MNPIFIHDPRKRGRRTPNPEPRTPLLANCLMVGAGAVLGALAGWWVATILLEWFLSLNI